MANDVGTSANRLFEKVGSFTRKCLFRVVSVGPVPTHIAFIMDGNRRYSKKLNLKEGAGHKAGFLALISMLRYCYELGVKYVTIYAFSIENFKRRPDEVQSLMDLLLEKIEDLMKKGSIVNQYGLRIYFIGNLKLLSEPVRTAAEKVMKSSANNSNGFLLICVAYTSTDEIVHAVRESSKSKMEAQVLNASEACNGVVEESEKLNGSSLFEGLRANGACNGVIEGVEGIVKRSGVTADAVRDLGKERRDQKNGHNTCSNLIEKVGASEMLGEHSVIKLVDVDRHMYMSVAPDPDILIRSSGETRLSNFLLWQTSSCPLYSPSALWPEIGLRHLVWAVLNFQRCHMHADKKRKQM